MRKIMRRPIAAIITAVLLTGCAAAPRPAAEPAAPEPAAEETAENTEPEAGPVIEMDDATDEALPEEEEMTEGAEELPPYEYPGPELFYYDLYKYLIDEYADDYPDAGICIPCPVIIDLDESDRDDIRVYGNFWVFKYVKNGDILECTSGGSYPGVIHVMNTDDGYEIIGMDVVEDGSRYTDSAKEIFGDRYNDFVKSNGDEEEFKRIRAQIIANYVFDKGLDIKAYQDYGWDPVPLPEQNIDSFYSNLG